MLKASDIFLLSAACISLGLSVGCWFFTNNQLAGVFIGLWVPSILGLGAYYKIAKFLNSNE
jgi:hypothetical protein